jgi:hypothetical protein
MIDFESLSTAFGASFCMIFLAARPENRFNRLGSRFQDFIEFQIADAHPVESLIDSMKCRASVTICNDESEERLRQKLDSWIAEFRPGDAQ